MVTEITNYTHPFDSHIVPLSPSKQTRACTKFLDKESPEGKKKSEKKATSVDSILVGYRRLYAPSNSEGEDILSKRAVIKLFLY